jgi:hypothetical protein
MEQFTRCSKSRHNPTPHANLTGTRFIFTASDFLLRLTVASSEREWIMKGPYPSSHPVLDLGQVLCHRLEEALRRLSEGARGESFKKAGRPRRLSNAPTKNPAGSAATGLSGNVVGSDSVLSSFPASSLFKGGRSPQGRTPPTQDLRMLDARTAVFAVRLPCV